MTQISYNSLDLVSNINYNNGKADIGEVVAEPDTATLFRIRSDESPGPGTFIDMILEERLDKATKQAIMNMESISNLLLYYTVNPSDAKLLLNAYKDMSNWCLTESSTTQNMLKSIMYLNVIKDAQNMLLNSLLN